MKSGWDNFGEEANRVAGDFLKLKDGDEVFCMFAGDPISFYAKYDKATNKTEQFGEYVQGSSWRFRINAIVKDGDGYTAKVLEQGRKFAKQLWECRNEYGMDCLYKIKRSGSSIQDTTYTIMFKDKLTGDQLKKVKEVPLHELGTGRTMTAPDADDDSDVPF